MAKDQYLAFVMDGADDDAALSLLLSAQDYGQPCGVADILALMSPEERTTAIAAALLPREQAVSIIKAALDRYCDDAQPNADAIDRWTGGGY